MKQFKLHALCSPFLLLCFVLLLVQCSSDEDTTLSNRDFDADSSISGAFELNGNGSFDPSGEGYNSFEENAWIEVSDEPVSTFSIDADGASYSNTRRYLNEHEELPPVDAIRTEEFINYGFMEVTIGVAPVRTHQVSNMYMPRGNNMSQIIT